MDHTVVSSRVDTLPRQPGLTHHHLRGTIHKAAIHKGAIHKRVIRRKVAVTPAPPNLASNHLLMEVTRMEATKVMEPTIRKTRKLKVSTSTTNQSGGVSSAKSTPS